MQTKLSHASQLAKKLIDIKRSDIIGKLGLFHVPMKNMSLQRDHCQRKTIFNLNTIELPPEGTAGDSIAEGEALGTRAEDEA